MKWNKTLYGFVLLMMAACYSPLEEVELGEHRPSLVIEGLITDQEPPYRIKITASVPFDDSVLSKPIEGAKVMLSSSDGQSEQLQMSEPGVYLASHLQGRPHVQYNLVVDVDSLQCTSQATLLPLAPFDSLTSEYKITPYIYGKAHVVKVFAQRTFQLDTLTFYRIKVYVNHTLKNTIDDIIIFSDELVSSIEGIELPYAFEAGDTVLVEAYSLDRKMFDYYISLVQMLYGNVSSQQGIIYEPLSNIEGGALGYFQASAVLRDSIIIPKEE